MYHEVRIDCTVRRNNGRPPRGGSTAGALPRPRPRRASASDPPSTSTARSNYFKSLSTARQRQHQQHSATSEQTAPSCHVPVRIGERRRRGGDQRQERPAASRRRQDAAPVDDFALEVDRVRVQEYVQGGE